MTEGSNLVEVEDGEEEVAVEARDVDTVSFLYDDEWLCSSFLTWPHHSRHNTVEHLVNGPRVMTSGIRFFESDGKSHEALDLSLPNFQVKGTTKYMHESEEA